MVNIINWLDGLDFGVLIWLLPAAITIHMIEEIIWLPEWSKTAGSWHIPVNSRQFTFASIILIAITFGLAGIVAHTKQPGPATYLALGLASTMILNIYFPHLGSMISLKRYAPGFATSILINLPVMTLLIWQAVSDGYVEIRFFLILVVPMMLAAAGGWSILLSAGSNLLK